MPAVPAASTSVPVPPRPILEPAAVPAIDGSRRLLVALLIAIIAGGQLYDTAVDGDHWPFSSYPMFAQPREPLIRMKRLYGVGLDGEERTIVVPRQLPPFHEARLMTAFKRLARHPERERRLEDALRASLELYERHRLAGVHDGVPLIGLRLYVVSWPFDPSLGNKDAPTERRLLAEVRR